MLNWLRRTFGRRVVASEAPPAHVIVADWRGARAVVHGCRLDMSGPVHDALGQWLKGERPVLVLPPGCQLTVYESAEPVRVEYGDDALSPI